MWAIPYRRIYYAGVLISCGGFKWRYIQIFCPKTGVVIKFLLKKWTLGAKKWRCIQICQKWRNNQDWRSICADTVVFILHFLSIIWSSVFFFEKEYWTSYIFYGFLLLLITLLPHDIIEKVFLWYYT